MWHTLIVNKFIIYLVVFVPFIIFGQSSFTERNPGTFEYIEYVDNLSDTTLVVLNNENFTSINYDGGSQLAGVFLNNKLIKIISWFGLSYGIISCEYYLKNEDLYFVSENFKGFKYDNKAEKFDYSEFDIFARGWYLFNSFDLVDTESLGHWRFEDESLDPKETIISEFNDYLKLLIKN
jgi:hypothetical protein